MFFLIGYLPAFLIAQDGTKSGTGRQSMPSWLKDHFVYMTEGNGVWITDNALFKSEQEPFDQYATVWKWGVGQQSIVGRLYALKNNKEVASFWEYRVFWHPHKQSVVFEQFGGSGVIGEAEMRMDSSQILVKSYIVDMVFYAFQGVSWRDRHIFTEQGDQHLTQSFEFKDGKWLAKRSYIWKRS